MGANTWSWVVAVLCLAVPVSPVRAQTTPAAADAPFQARYAANLQSGESYIDIINTGFNGPPLGPGFSAGSAGNICVSVYAMDPAEELIGGCSCLITPHQTVNLGVIRDVLGNTLTSAVPTSVTIKVVGSNASATNCTNTAAMVNTINMLTGGFVAFLTTLHATPKSGVFASTETPFLPVGISSQGVNSELTSLAGRCGFILANAGGFGVCSSCRAGALGAQKQ